ncbi:putative myosin class II heavy chain (MHC) [Aspergillus ruber CBS 135680]|uniref:Myosin class II heavy chain n=1 Tax=Aspergillus ruber (strain CBS 135680) TaxID=1388766 RepID=A0A017SGF5_ASPRC|nr:uncharacterized protein EURHEDRAFT_515247 [Aspergillus ruber CBS 135680]EYE95375.1 hypothetical protein EURHEDRAFT_515247 [Aspergillus ruber CBS 135680]
MFCAFRSIPSYLSAPFASLSTSPGVSNLSTGGSPGPLERLRRHTITPNPPTFPNLARYRSTGESLNSSPENRRPESSVYYTTAWGSPYAVPSPRTLSLTFSQSQNAGVDRESGASSPTSMPSGIFQEIEPSSDNNNNNNSNSNNGFLRPSGGESSARNLYSGILDRSPGRDLFGRKGGKSIKDFTQDWINQYLSGQPRTERSNWLSDDSGSEAPSFFTAQNHFADDDWLGLEEDSRDEELLRTPTLADFASRKKGIGQGESSTNSTTSTARQKIKDYIHKRTETLKQEDFWGFAYDKDPQPIAMDNTETLPPTESEANKVASPVEKPLPPPPAEEPIDRTPQLASSNAENVQKYASNPRPDAPKPPVLSRTGTSTLQRTKKKIPWRGKACIIALPLEDKRGSEESGHRLMRPEDVEQRLRKWEEEGYDNSGFTISNLNDQYDTAAMELGGSSRPVFPDPTDVQGEWTTGEYGVRFPDKAVWDSYVNFLQEEKLRALGVSLGDEEEAQPSVSPASAAMGQMAPFPGLIASPPIPTASAAGNPLAVPHPFSPQLNQSTNTPNGIGALASPASQFSVQTPFLGVDQNLLAGYPLPFQPTPPAQGSFTPQSFLNARQAGAIPGTLPNLSSMLSPVSPLNDQGPFHPGLNGKESFDNQGQPLPRAQTPTEQPDHFHASNVEIAHPTPRGHSRGQNLSETLQKGLDQINHSDYHLERSIERQLEEDDRDAGRDGFKNSGLLHSKWAMPEADPNQYHGYNHHDGSDIDTNPSLSGAPHGHGPLANDIAWHESKPSMESHRSKLSSSTFNVEAKEFDPMGTFASQNFGFQDNAFQFQGVDPSLFTFGTGQGVQGAMPPTASYNVTAPTFNPPGVNSQKSAGPDEFKFSSASFNVDAPAFNPGGVASSGQPSGETTKIFGDISDVSTPAKKSKAIPIVRPDESEHKEKNKGVEGENANAQPGPADRNKRARRGDQPSDGEEQLSVPTRALTDTNNAKASQDLTAPHKQTDGKGNIAPSKESLAAAERKDTPVSEASTWAPAEGREQAETSGSPVRHQAPEQGPEKAAEQPPVEKAPTPAPKEQDKGAEKSSTDTLKNKFLSAAAKSFEFKPAVPEFVPPSNEKSPSVPEKPANGLMSSRYAVEDPSASPKEKPLPPEPQYTSSEESPDEDELNAIMEQLNDDSDVGIERINTPQPKRKLPEPVAGPSKEKRHVPAEIRSEAPSPSPGRGTLDIPKLDFESRSQLSVTPSKSMIGTITSPVRQLLHDNDRISDWDDIISSGEDDKLLNRSRFFDRRINDLVGSAVEERLSPLERALGVIQQSVTSIASGAQNKWTLQSTSATGEDSDADDEDDEYEDNSSVRPKSPMQQQKDRRLDKLKNVIQEALAAHAPPQEVDSPATIELLQLKQSFAELRELTSEKLSQDPAANLKNMIQEVVSSQLQMQNSRPSDAEEIGADSLMLQIDGLKNMLRLADERAEQEYKMRREGQDSIAELQRLLKVAEEDAARHSEAAESAETRFLQFKEEKIPYFENIQSRSDSLSQERESLRLTLAEISSKNITLQGTIDEHRVSSEHYKRENERQQAELERTNEENKKLHETIEHLQIRLGDGISIRQNLSDKFDYLQGEMVNVTRDITRDQANWRRKEEAYVAGNNELRAAYSRELKLREKLEVDISELEQQEREAAKLKFIFGQSQQENARLEELVGNLRLENHSLESKAVHFEREFNEARESSRMEIQRTRTSLETDLEAANSQVNIVRAELEAQIIRLQSQQENIRMDADTARESYEMLLEAANEAKAEALASKELALDDQRKAHERVLNDLRERHVRAMHNNSEDKVRQESYMSERLALSEDKARHLQDRVSHLEEKLEIAKSAARAAAEAAQTAKVSPGASDSQSLPPAKGSDVPEKISPQALRESILVLQDQLQQRESRIDELEQEVGSVDKEAPNKLKERDAEITWLRELLGVRLDDLQDIINTVSKPSFNQHAVRDAAIRLRANLQMQLQERERAMTGQSFPSLSITELAASPRNLPLAAAAAWGSWRRTRENSATDQTPSKPSNASNFFSGLLTPPGSNARQSPRANALLQSGSRRTSESRPMRSFNPTPRPLSGRHDGLQEPPKTPPLLRRSSYDQDAESTTYEHDEPFPEDGEAESMADEITTETMGTEDGLEPMPEAVSEPFGPEIISD